MQVPKFRIWDTLREEFLSAGTISIVIHRGKTPKINILLDGIMDITEDSRFIIMQYTEVNDKNNKDIYDGDILKCEAGEYIGNVWFANGSFMTNCEGFGDHPISQTNSDDFEIIGNILQNAELLKEGG